MNRHKLACIGFVLSFFAILSVARVNAQDGMPIGWVKAGAKPTNYVMTVDTTVTHGGSASACLQFVGQQPDGFATLAQNFKPDAYRGKRLRMSAWVKTEKPDDRAQLWTRLDALKRIPGFDNMTKRPITGTTDWQRYEIVLYVTSDTVNIAFGVMSFGTGRVWADDFTFEVVSAEVPVTDINTPEQRDREVDNSWLSASKFPAGPLNLDFEGGANPVRKPVAVNPKIYDDYAGYYQVQTFVNTVTRKGDALWTDGDDGQSQQLFPLSDSEFFFKGVPGTIRFVKDPQGKVTEAIANLAGGERHLKRIDAASAKARGAQIMAAAHQAKGGLDKLKAVHNIWHDGIRNQPGTPTNTFDLYISENNESFSETRDSEGKFASKSYSDGKAGWDYDGKETRPHNETRTVIARYHWQFVWLEVTLLPFTGNTLEAYALDDDVYEGKPVEVVLAVVKGDNFEAKYVLSFDKQSHLLRRIFANNPNGRTDYSYDEYLDVNGVKLAGLAVISTGSTKRSIKISNYKINAGIEPQKFSKP